jgi:hypothetical protein
MRTIRLLAGSVLTVGVVGLAAAPTTYASGPGTLRVQPSAVAPGAIVTVHTGVCGAERSASGDASAVGAGTFTLAPQDTGTGAAGRFQVPPSAQPGTYEILARCADGHEVTGDLTVAMAGAAGPTGHVDTGVGGALGSDPVKTTAGVAALAVAAAGGTWLLHRRARNDGL